MGIFGIYRTLDALEDDLTKQATEEYKAGNTSPISVTVKPIIFKKVLRGWRVS